MSGRLCVSLLLLSSSFIQNCFGYRTAGFSSLAPILILNFRFLKTIHLKTHIIFFIDLPFNFSTKLFMSNLANKALTPHCSSLQWPKALGKDRSFPRHEFLQNTCNVLQKDSFISALHLIKICYCCSGGGGS